MTGALKKTPLFKLCGLCLLAFFSFVFGANAQICNGSFGDPVVNLTFGSGNTGPSSFVPTRGYTFTSDPCPDDGYYTITNQITNCFGDSWQHVASDHTGNGNFMLVNASFQPGDFFLTTVTSLCPNTTYEFSAWIMNVMVPTNSILPNITFHIEQTDGTLLASFETGNIAVANGAKWTKYGFLFTTPPDNATIVLRLTNNAPGGIGNDIALDDISFRPCGGKIDAAVIDNKDTINVCEGDQTKYQFAGSSSSFYQNPVYQWQFSSDSGKIWTDILGATLTSYTRPSNGVPGTYSYRLTVVDASVASIPTCRIASDPLVIIVHPDPLVDAGPDRIFITNYPVTLHATASGESISFNWVPPLFMDDTSILNPTVSPPNDITYSLNVKSSAGCTKEDTMHVKVVSGIFVPTAFTPNGDGKNDFWRIPFLDIGFNAEVLVFNRWGKLVYHATGTTISWNGSLNGIPQPSGVYAYIIKFRTSNHPDMKGTITLIR